MKSLGLLSIAVCLAQSGMAQTRLLKPPSARNPTIIAGPVSLTAVSNRSGMVFLTWPAAPNAERYLVQIARVGTVADFLASTFVFEGADCVSTSGMPNCVYTDSTEPFARRSPAGSVYPHRIASGYDYVYQVVAVFAGGVTSPPSPPATVLVK